MLYSVGEVASELGVHWRTLHNWERTGLVSPSRAGGRRVYSVDDLDRLRRLKAMTAQYGPRGAMRVLELERRVEDLEASLAARR